jgi:hypothetical protein
MAGSSGETRGTPRATVAHRAELCCRRGVRVAGLWMTNAACSSSCLTVAPSNAARDMRPCVRRFGLRPCGARDGRRHRLRRAQRRRSMRLRAFRTRTGVLRCWTLRSRPPVPKSRDHTRMRRSLFACAVPLPKAYRPLAAISGDLTHWESRHAVGTTLCTRPRWRDDARSNSDGRCGTASSRRHRARLPS